MCVQNLKTVALPVAEVRGTQKIWAVLDSLDMPTLPFLQNFNGPYSSDASYKYTATFEVRSLLSFTCSWVNRRGVATLAKNWFGLAMSTLSINPSKK